MLAIPCTFMARAAAAETVRVSNGALEYVVHLKLQKYHGHPFQFTVGAVMSSLGPSSHSENGKPWRFPVAPPLSALILSGLDAVPRLSELPRASS